MVMKSFEVVRQAKQDQDEKGLTLFACNNGQWPDVRSSGQASSDLR